MNSAIALIIAILINTVLSLMMYWGAGLGCNIEIEKCSIIPYLPSLLLVILLLFEVIFFLKRKTKLFNNLFWGLIVLNTFTVIMVFIFDFIT